MTENQLTEIQLTEIQLTENQMNENHLTEIIWPKSFDRNQLAENHLTEIIEFKQYTFINFLVIAPACSLCDITIYVRFRSKNCLLVTNIGLEANIYFTDMHIDICIFVDINEKVAF